MGFVGNYAPCGLSPQTDGMPVIPKKAAPRYGVPLCNHLKTVLSDLRLDKTVGVTLSLIYYIDLICLCITEYIEVMS